MNRRLASQIRCLRPHGLVAGTYRGRDNLKLRLIKEGVKDSRCEAELEQLAGESIFAKTIARRSGRGVALGRGTIAPRRTASVHPLDEKPNAHMQSRTL